MRLRTGFTQEKLAQHMGTHRPIVCRIERGVHSVDLHTITSFVLACGGNLQEVTLAVDRALGLPQPTMIFPHRRT
jgi:transcriptional regulator with XRE-family HTH domain